MGSDNTALSVSQKGLALFYSLVLLSACLLIVNEAWLNLQLLQNVEKQPFYIEFMPLALAVLWLVPVMFMLSYVLLVRTFPILPMLNIKLLIKAALPCLLLLLISRIGVGVLVSDYLTAKGFSRCDGLSRPTALSGQVWLSKQSYCHAESYLVSKEILNWFDKMRDSDIKPSPDEVTDHIKTLIEQFKTNNDLN